MQNSYSSNHCCIMDSLERKVKKKVLQRKGIILWRPLSHLCSRKTRINFVGTVYLYLFLFFVFFFCFIVSFMFLFFFIENQLFLLSSWSPLEWTTLFIFRQKWGTMMDYCSASLVDFVKKKGVWRPSAGCPTTRLLKVGLCGPVCWLLVWNWVLICIKYIWVPSTV